MARFGPFGVPGGETSAPGSHGIEQLVTVAQPGAAAAEAYRTLWTNVAFGTVGQSAKMLLFTSPDASEGKSTTLANLGVVAARAGRRVVLVDCDLRRPRLQAIFDLPNATGLTTSLLDESPKVLPDQETAIGGLRVLTTGPLPSNPAEVLSSPRMDRILDLLREGVDLVMVDTPPAGLVADALTLAPRVDGVILVVDATRTRREQARRTKNHLERVRARILGVVLSNARIDPTAYRY